MIYLVSNQQELFESTEYKTITLEESLEVIKDWKIYQYDSETTGRDAHVNDILCIQIGNLEGTIQLVIDATTGQNGISQAKSFKEITDITGIVLTKLDGTAKGGIVLAIKEEVNIPVKFVGLGEREDQIEAFDIEKYIYGLFKDL